jgi:SAM-dependent methyltransferase
MSLYRKLIRAGPIWGLIRPGYPDEARLIAQGVVLRALLDRKRSPEGRILNAGCGEGLYLPLLERTNFRSIVNFDITVAETVKTTHRSARHSFIEGSLTELPFPDAVFDCVLCTEVLEHIEDDKMALSELARVLKPGGQLLISVPEAPAPFDPDHVRQGYTQYDLANKLGVAGFQVTKVAKAMFLPTRLLMHYWRHPLVRFGAQRKPYVPRPIVVAIGHLDSWLRIGGSWDLVILAERRL